MAGGFARGAAAVSTLGTLGQMAVGAGLATGAVVAAQQLGKAWEAAAAERQPQQAPPPLTPEEQAARQRLAEQQEWLAQQGGFSGLVEAGGQPATWDSNWQRTLQARGQVK